MKGDAMKKIILTMMITAICFFAYGSDIYGELEKSALSAGVSPETALMLAEKTRSAGFSSENLSKIQQSVTSIYTAGAQKTAEKVLEGIAKNVDQDRIVRAVEAVRSRYEKSLMLAEKTGVTQANRFRVAENLADAMAAGATEEKLSEIAEMVSQKESLKDSFAESTFSFYKDMMRYGVSEEKSFDVSRQALMNSSAENISSQHMEFNRQAGFMDPGSAAEHMQDKMNNMGSGNMSTGGMDSGGSGGGMGGGSGGGGSGGGGSGGGNKR